MYLYDRRLSGTQVRPSGNPGSLRPSQRYFYARRDPMMNRVGEFAALREVPANQISIGEFGRTLSNGITIPAPAVALLRLSNRFTTMIGTLDQSYVSIWLPGFSSHRLPSTVPLSIADEIVTRGIEATVVSEILQTTVGAQQLQGQQPGNKATLPSLVQRDFFPGQLRRTYLEYFVLRELIREAIDRQQLSDAQIQAQDRQVQSIPLQGWRSRTFPSDEYSKLRFWLRVIDSRWQTLKRLHPPQSPAFEWGREIVLQEHANAFFGGVTGGKIGYTALPAALQPRPPVRRAAPTKP